MKTLITIFLLGCVSVIISAQCECQDCPLVIPDEGTSQSQITISGANSPIIGSNNQRVRAIRLNFTHNAISQLTIRLRQPNNPNFNTIINGFGSEIIPNVAFNICLVHCFEESNPDQGINNNTTYTGSYYIWDGCLDFPFGSTINGTWTLEFIENTPGGGGELLGWSLDFVDNSGTGCVSTCFQPACPANGGNISPLSQSFCEGSLGLNFNIPPDFGSNVPNPALFDYYYVITSENGTVLEYLTTPDLTSFPPGTYNICGLSVLSEDFTLLPQAGVGNNISDIQQGIDNQLYCADLSVGCRTVTIQAGAGTPDILGPDTVCVNQLATFELVGLDVSAWSLVSVTGPFSSFISSNLPFVNVTWLPGPQTRTVCATYNNGCISGTICKEVTIISPTPIAINGPTAVCAGQVIEYTLAPAVDWDISVIGGNLISQTQTSFQVEWFENGGNNSVAVQYEGPCATTGPVILLITLSSYELPTTLNSPDFLCLSGQGQSSVPSDPGIVNYIWSGTGITIQSGLGTNSVQYTVTSPGQVEICLEVETTCGNQGPICETIVVEVPINPEITGPTEACIGEVLTFTLDGLTEEQFVSFGVTGELDFLEFDFPVLNLSYGSGTSESEEICINFNSLCSGSDEICFTVNIFQTNDIEISGPQIVCEGQSYTYEIIPPLTDGSTFEVSINGGSLLSQTVSEIEIIWDNLQPGGGNTISLVIDDATCGLQEPILFQVDIFEPPLLVIDPPNSLCEGSIGAASANFDNSLFSYNWFGAGVIIVDGQGSNGPISFSADQAGVFQLCVEAESLCGLLDPVCIDIDVQEPAIPDILPVDPTCNFNFVLSSSGNTMASSSWNQVDGPSMATIQLPNSSLTNVSVTEPGMYTFEYLEDNGICQSSNTIEVEVLLSPIIEISNIICEEGAYQVTLSINSLGNPFLVNGISIVGNQFVSDFIPGGEPYSFTVTDNNNCESIISGSFTCPCIANAGTMSDQPLYACISSGDVVIGISNNDAVLDVNDIGLFVLHDNPGATLGTIFDTNEDGLFSFLPDLIPGQIYYISFVIGQELNNSFNPNDPCLSVSPGQPVVFFDDPVITIVNTGPFCVDGVLEAILSSDVTSLEWEFIDGPGIPLIQNPNSPNTSVSFSGEGAYSFLLTASNPACTVSELIDIESLPPVSIENQNITCLDLNNYILSYSIIGSGSNYTVSIPGIIDGNEFTSDPLDPNISYFLTITDDNGCSTSRNINPINCSCGNFAGTMSLDTLFICESEGVINLSFNEDATVGPFDTSLFVIHTLSGAELGDALFFTEQLSFDIPSVLEFETLYFVSNLVTSIDEDGNPDLSGSCLSISQGQPIFIYRNPVFELPSDTSTCFESLSLAFPNNNGGQFSILEDQTNVDFSFESDPGTLFFNPDMAGVLRLIYEETNGTCTRTDSLEVTFWDRPFAEQIEISCIDDFYVVQLTVAGGAPPYEVNGVLLATNTFVSDPISSNSPFSISITDGRACSAEIITVSQNCACDSNAGQISNPLLVLCDQADINLNEINLSGFNIPDGFELFFFLTDQPIWDPANILAQNGGFIIPWSDDLVLETTYYLFAVVTRLTDGVDPDFSDACLATSNVLPVLWRVGVEVEIAGSAVACVGSEQLIQIQASGTLPVNVLLRNNLGEEIEVELNVNSLEISYLISNPGQIIWEIASAESVCEAAASGTFIINAIEEEDIIILDPPQLCNNRDFGSELNLNSLLANENEGEWSFNGLVIENGIFDADGLEPGMYEVEFSTVGFSEPCPGKSTTISIGVDECLCPEVNFPDSIGFCSSEGIISLDELFNISAAGEWSISVISGNGDLPLLFNNQIDLSRLNGFFHLAFTYLSELPEECPVGDTIILEIERSANVGVSSFGNIVCPVGDEFISLDDLLIGADEGGLWVNMQGLPVSNIISRNTLSPGINLFVYEFGGDLCPLAQGFVELVLRDSLLFNANISQALCPDEESTVLIDSQSSNFTLLINDVPQEGGPVFLLSPGISTLQIADAFGCVSELLEVEIVATETILIDLGEDRTVGSGRPTILAFTTNITDEDIGSISWLAFGEVIQTEGRSLELIVNEDQTIQVTLITIQGCTANAEINLTVAQAPVYIPNAFYPGSANAANQRFGPLSPQGIMGIESFQIFDRWGNKVWEVSEVEEVTEAVFWDGTFKGREAAEGVYVYKLVYTDNQGKSIVSSGEVMLLK